MLILTRRSGETLMIGDGDDMVTITVLGVKGNQVRIGVNAPKEVPVHRSEIYERIQREKVQKLENQHKRTNDNEPEEGTLKHSKRHRGDDHCCNCYHDDENYD